MHGTLVCEVVPDWELILSVNRRSAGDIKRIVLADAGGVCGRGGCGASGFCGLHRNAVAYAVLGGISTAVRAIYSSSTLSVSR